MTAFLYPVALDVENKRCVIVGGGTVGLRKAHVLAAAHARVVIVDPYGSKALEGPAWEWISAPFEPAHLDGAFLVIAATDRPAVNHAVCEAARARNVLLNLAASTDGKVDGGDFATMASVSRGDLLFAVTTGGAGPALAARLRDELNAAYGPEWGMFTDLLGQARHDAKETIADPLRRVRVLRELAQRDDLRELLARGEEDEAKQRVAECLL